MADFFVSYTSADRQWAEWIAFVLEEESWSVTIQAWDFRPGSNFVLEMQKAAAEAPRTIMVLSPDYIKSEFASSEWAAAFSQDPQGLKLALVPVVVRECQITGLVKPLVHINLVGADEMEARKILVGGVRASRAKPDTRPAFPGMSSHPPHIVFPGKQTPSAPLAASPVYLPKVRRAPSDIDKKRFVKQAFDTIRAYFETALDALARHSSTMEFDFQPNTATEFTAEIFVNGQIACSCRIWLGDALSMDGICYAEGRYNFGSNSCNEILSLKDGGGELWLSSLLGIGFGIGNLPFNLKEMTKEQAAEYLWRRFVVALEK